MSNSIINNIISKPLIQIRFIHGHSLHKKLILLCIQKNLLFGSQRYIKLLNIQRNDRVLLTEALLLL
jgi:hypothetical protein